VERESFAAMVVSVLLLLLLILLRTSIRWYGENRLGVHSTRLREQLRRAYGAFLNTAT
jgi:ABC-type transport system involved in cytochrome bd biosynthesis fused ATPase/permease subunit